MKQDETPPAAPKPPPAAAALFGSRLDLAVRYADILSDSGVSHGLIGPREAPRLWDRHLLNCAVVESVLPHLTRLIDVGSGAGLPGMVLAIARPDLEVALVEPMLRRTTWLEGTVAELGLTNVTVHRGRAQEFWGRLRAPVVTARAVARLSELAGWSLPLLEPHGRLVALKGETAGDELAGDLALLRRMGVQEATVTVLGEEMLETPSRLVELSIGARLPQRRPPTGKGRPNSRGGSRRQGPRQG